MPKGGHRDGAGRKKGVPNKITSETIAAAAAGGEMPKEYMLRVMRDLTVDHDRRDRMATAVAPYVHSRLTSTEVTGKDGKDLIPDRSPREIARAFLGVIRKASAEPDDPDGDRPSDD